MNKKNILLKVLIAVFMVVIACSMVACDFGSSNSGSGSSGSSTKDKTTTTDLKPSDIKVLTDLTDYTSKATKTAVSYSNKQYAGKDCTEQYNALQNRITEKQEDVDSGESTKSFVKIFVMSTPDGLLSEMADAALTFDEMKSVVAYISGSVTDPDISAYCAKDQNDNWVGELTGSNLKSWRRSESDTNASNNDFNKGWSLFDDWELYDNLKDYAEDCKNSSNKDTADDNASWQYRSILQKVYEDVNLNGDVAARLITHMLDYAITLVEEKTQSTVDDCVENSDFNDFAKYCRKKVTEEDDPMDGLGDYDTLVYLCAFNELSDGWTDSGVKACVKLYGYYYDYNATYYEVELKDRATYAKQLKYEKQETFTNDEWLDYVAIQRKNYTGSYRYSEKFYKSFYTVHFNFQGMIESYELEAYPIEAPTTTSYTKEMQKAIQDGENGIKGQLAMSDYLWCYSGSDANMKSYNKASKEYHDAKDNTKAGTGTKEKEYEKKFAYEMEELKLVAYLLDKMTDTELNGALYYNCYAYSGSMVKTMQTYLKDIKYIEDDMEDGEHYTNIASTVGVSTEEQKDQYAMGKLKVLEEQCFDDWDNAGVSAKAGTDQNWAKMLTDIKDAQSYSYEEAVPASDTNCWKTRCEYLEDRVIAKKYSCCDTRISEPDTNTTHCTHGSNEDGTAVTKEYDTTCTISQFVSKYEDILFYIAGTINVEFDTPTAGFTTSTPSLTTAGDTIVYNPGYTATGNTIASIRSSSANTQIKYDEEKTISFSSGKALNDVIEDSDLDTEDEEWWNENNTHDEDGTDNGFGPVSQEETNTSGKKNNYTYTYTFSYWYLDKDCKYEFDPDDEIDFDVILYAGYTVEKQCK